MPTSLLGLANKARAKKQYVFRDLYVLINEEYLHECWGMIRKDAACGVDGVSVQEYEQELEENINNLVEGLKRNFYHAKLVRRHYIPKPDGRQRPLGIPATQDKLMQLAVARILQAIYEEDFLPVSYGYRPNRSAHDAVFELTRRLQFGAYSYVVEADIKGFFDNIDHDKLIEMLSMRLGDQRLLRLINKWLKAGVLDTDGKVIQPTAGSPQGGIVSPVLANVYLHYVLDLWFQDVVTRYCKGRAFIIRFADDFVCGFEKEEDAVRFRKALGLRLEKYGLELAPDKTRVMSFDRSDKSGANRFDFLGFEFRWGVDRQGKDHITRRTSRKKLRNTLQSFTQWCRQNRNLRLGVLFAKLNRKLRGYYNYYAITGNFEGIREFYYNVKRILLKWLNRRSQRRSYNWAAFVQLLDHFKVPRPRILHYRPSGRKTPTLRRLLT
jgi:group II intron reverse transcriptase/maturase